MAGRSVLLFSVAGGLINLECRERWCLSHSLYMMYVSAISYSGDSERCGA